MINLGVMQVEDRVGRAGEEIAHVAADGLMGSDMYALESGSDAGVQHLVQDGDVGAVEKSAHLVHRKGILCSSGLRSRRRQWGL